MDARLGADGAAEMENLRYAVSLLNLLTGLLQRHEPIPLAFAGTLVAISPPVGLHFASRLMSRTTRGRAADHFPERPTASRDRR
jgi:hypothetical protein